VADELLLTAFRFRVRLLRSADVAAGGDVTGELSQSGATLGDGGFAECSGLEVEMDVSELLEGGRNDWVVKRVGRSKYPNIVLKRGMFHPAGGEVNRDLWSWLEGVVSGVRPVARYDGIVEVMSGGEAVAARWTFKRGLPAKIAGPQLNAKTGEVCLEELHIAHEGLRLESV
jgi:phage tail-like protein